jgi:F-type H+-transporting ATPase subunit delta
MILMGGSSRQSLVALRENLDKTISGLSSADCAAISKDLFVALLAVDSSVALRRAFTDPARDAASKAELLSDLFGGKLGAKAQSLLAQAVALRWSSSMQMVDALEQIAVETQASAANIDGQLDRVHDEIFAFSRILVENPDLRQAFNTRSDSDARKIELLNSIFASKFSAHTVTLLAHAFAGLRGRHIERTVVAYSHAVTERLNRVNAHVRTAVALTDGQKKKLNDTLSKHIGQTVHLNVEVDPSVLGGLSIRFEDEIIDGTIINRLAEAGRALAV